MIRRPRSGQRGAVSVLAVLLIATIAMAALVSIDLGNVFYRQRQLQSMVDLAALSAAQQLKQAGTDATQRAAAFASAKAVAGSNGYPSQSGADCSLPTSGSPDGMKVCIGVWDPAYTSANDTASHFTSTYDNTKVSPNAARVTATQTVPVLFVIPGSASRQLRAQAVAVGSPPSASFSIGSGLLSINDPNGAANANSLLGLLLGRTVNLSVADWNGLVNAKVSLAQLQLKLGAGSIQELLNTSLSIQDFYALVLGAAGQDSLVSVLLGGVKTVGVNAAQATVSLGQLLDLGVLAPTQSAAANVGLNVSTLLTLAAQVANGGSALAVPNLSVPLPGASIGLNLYVIQPPVSAAGPVWLQGTSPEQWATTAHTAQVGLGLRVSVGADLLLNALGLGALSDVLNALGGVRLDIPLYVEVAGATAALTGIQCTTDRASRQATFSIKTSVAKACLGRTDGTAGCASGGVSLVNLAIISVSAAPATSQVGASNTFSRTLPINGTTHVSSQQLVSGLLDDVLSNLQLQVNINLLFFKLSVPLYLNVLLQPIAPLLDSLLATLLNLLGIQVGTADVWLNDISCKNSDLVY
ncbi:TadG family pilus assembly protein [Cupriavidus malaysiensis]|uniref:DUF2134 domain-containing protein n=1 Tax=Cupriavidus malaysiensis TaxID=367825 RepID=A0ABM6F9T4_9BURK|nr:TadG family pilus assembly protein [Cupriavidus malaysiensis]AOZ08450.1 hypothetical protein BKK80_21060 [Cupriavidus malaysiensis]